MGSRGIELYFSAPRSVTELVLSIGAVSEAKVAVIACILALLSFCSGKKCLTFRLSKFWSYFWKLFGYKNLFLGQICL